MPENQGPSTSSAPQNLQPSIVFAESISQSTFAGYPVPIDFPDTQIVPNLVTSSANQGNSFQGSSNDSTKNSSADDQDEIFLVEVCSKLKGEGPLKTVQYQALTDAHLATLLFCKSCGWRFDYVMEWVLHFNLVGGCLTAIKTGFSQNLKLSQILKVYASRVASSKTKFACFECSKVN